MLRFFANGLLIYQQNLEICQDFVVIISFLFFFSLWWKNLLCLPSLPPESLSVTQTDWKTLCPRLSPNFGSSCAQSQVMTLYPNLSQKNMFLQNFTTFYRSLLNHYLLLTKLLPFNERDGSVSKVLAFVSVRTQV